MTPNELFDLNGHVAVVTGGAAGLGRSICEVLALAGAAVVIADRDVERAQATAEALRDIGARADAVHVDVTDEASVIEMFGHVVNVHNRLSILVNNAGWYPKFAFTETTVDDWDAVHRVNLRGTFLCMREAAKLMRSGGAGGRIINISSLSSLHPVVNGNAAYAASKAGVNGLVRAAALDLAPDGITVNAVLPAAINTGNTRQHIVHPVTGPAADRGWLLGRRSEPQETAAVVLLLAGPSGGWISGQSIALDGGFLVS